MHRILPFLLLTTMLLSQTQPKPSAAAAKTGPTFGQLADEFIREGLALSPSNASQAGYHKHTDSKTGKTIALDGELDDLSPEGVARQRAFYQRWQGRFRRETPLRALNLQDQADWRLVDDQISLNLLEFDRIRNYKYNPTVYVELIGGALFQPLTSEYAPKDVRLRHVIARIGQIPHLLEQAKQNLEDADPIFVKVAVEENTGNLDLIENTVAKEIPADSPLKAEFDRVRPPAVTALKDFSRWLEEDLGKRKPSRTWRLGKELYAQKFKLVMQTAVTPEQLLADAERDLKAVRSEMFRIATPMHAEMFAEHSDHSDLGGREYQNTIISEVLHRISDDHAKRDELIDAVKRDLDRITQFIRDKKIVSLSQRQNLKVIPTPMFLRGIYSVAGFHSAPPLEPQTEAQYWVTPIDPKMPDDKAESKLREYNNWVLQWLTIHEALPGHYIQFEHANNVQPESRRVLRALLGNGPYIEGWAEYIAQVMIEQGFANSDPRYILMMRKLRLRLLANTILDVRMQTMNMSDQEAMDLMTQDAFQTQAEAEGKLQRAKLSSAQLPTYYVGLRDWLRLREKYQAAKGKDFSLLEFHDKVLDQGPLPIAYLEKLVLPASKAPRKKKTASGM